MADLNHLEILAQNKINPSAKSVQARLAQAEEKAQERFDNQNKPKNVWVSERITTFLGYLALFFVATFMTVGVGAILVAGVTAEFTSVYKGFFEVTPNVIISASLSLTFLLAVVVLAFIKNIAYEGLEHRPKGTLREKFAGLIRWCGFKSLLWVSADEAYVPDKESKFYYDTLKAITFIKVVIVAVSATGRLNEILERIGGVPLFEFIEKFFDNLTGKEGVHLLIVAVSLWALLIVLDFTVGFVYRAYRMSAGDINLGNSKAGESSLSLAELYDQEMNKAMQEILAQQIYKTNKTNPQDQPATVE